MKYVSLLVLLFGLLVGLWNLGSRGRATLWRTARPFVFFALIAAAAVVAVILVANGGGQFRIL